MFCSNKFSKLLRNFYNIIGSNSVLMAQLTRYILVDVLLEDFSRLK